MCKTLLIISGGTEAVPGIRLAAGRGLNVVVSDIAPDAPGFAFAHDRLIASTYNVEETVMAAKKYHQSVRPIDGVMCMAADVPGTVAAVADALGLPGLTMEAARLSSNKLEMKQVFAEKGIPIPWFREVHSLPHLQQTVADHGLPLVIKPIDSRGARGVLRITPRVDLDFAFKHSREHSPCCRVMVEEFLEGPQISTESVLLEDADFTPGFIDRNYDYLERFAPYMIEDGGQQPTTLSLQDKEAVTRLGEAAGRALGIVNGIAKGDLVLTAQGPKVIEIAARLSGGWMSSHQIPLATGIDLVGAAIKLALGEKVNPDHLESRYSRGVAIRYFFPEPGRVVKISNTKEFEQVDWVARLAFFVGPGDILEAVSDHTRRAGFVITTGETRDQALVRARQVIETIEIETIPG